ncbi:kinase-like protein [Canariomyces notabilis]|uniref:Kinase-like protein n=1 Tax=Canariomyces notabilis TaxID=2074819 RepID=A0AAN6TGD2_9PEZI|nr:kinase-like protein [Canariomyces arenarius]
MPVRDLSKVIKEREPAAGVHRARLIPDNRLCVYKEVDRPLYEPRDTDIMEQELKNLSLLRGATYVVQLIAAVVSTNPYRSSREDGDDDSRVLRGLLIEYHPNGTLADALRRSDHRVRQPWRKWALQIACGLRELHTLGLTHMDLKPSNIVISAEGDAVLLDISGQAIITQEWLSPEMRDLFSPCSQDLGARVQNDVWAFGKILSQMVSASSDDVERERLTNVTCLTEVSPRITLCDAISRLNL